MKARFLGALAAAALLCAAAVPLAASGLDLVVVADTSESMFPFFDDLMNGLVHTLLTEKLHRGDTFHLISFSSTPEVELSLEVSDEEAAQRAFDRILLLHALSRYTDLVAALRFLGTYVHELPESDTRQILLITDGIHDPPPGSPNRGTPEETAKAVADAARALAGQGLVFDILSVPPETATGAAGLESYLPDVAKELGVEIVSYPTADKSSITGRATGFPDLVFPPGLGRVSSRFSAPFRVRNWKREPIIVRLSRVFSDGVDLLDGKVEATVGAMTEATLDVPLRLPPSYPPGEHTASVRLVFDGDLRMSPTQGALSFTFTGKGGIPIPRLTFLYGIYILLGLGVLYLLVRLFLFMRAKLGEATMPGAEEAKLRRGGGAPTGHARDRGKVGAVRTRSATRRSAAPGRRARPTAASLKKALPRRQMEKPRLPSLIEMRVSEQNHRIGFRNVHRIPPGAARTVGGRFSSYLIYLVPMPPSIGEIRNEDGRYVFVPLRKELFPRLSAALEDCLEVDIPFVTPGGREMTLQFREWLSPREEMNRLMRPPRDSGSAAQGGPGRGRA